MKKSKSIIKRIISIVTALVIIVTILPPTSYIIVKKRTDSRIFDNTEEIPYNRVGLLLGTNPTLKNGKQNYYFKYRIEACVRLYKEKKISKIIVSGDNHIKEYDEPEYMKQALMAHGIPEKDIVLDYAGFRTLDSVIRAKEVFGQEKITIISQNFHNERAVYLALANGIDAVALNAKEFKNSHAYLKTGFLRESLARVKMFLDIWTGKQPKFLGEKINI